jgi:GntR family transcriptional regulator
MVIDKESPLPIYYQIQESLKEKIKSGELRPGDKISSEHELCEQFNVSRMTIRQAINNLVKESYLYRKRGIGTFVQQPKVEQRLQGLTSFTEDMEARGLTPTSILISFEVVESKKSVADELAIEEGTPIYRIHRSRLANGEPIALEWAYIPVALMPNLTESVVHRSLYNYVEKELGLSLVRATQTIEASIATEVEEKWLEVDSGDPVLIVEQCSYLAENQPLELVKCVYRADRYKFITNIERTENTNPM